MTKLLRRKKQKPEHVLVWLKNELNLSQAEIPDYLGISLATFKNIVQEKVKSWDRHAAQVQQAIGVSAKSLLANNPRKPLMATDGKRWTARKYKAGIARRYEGDLIRERSRGRHTLQWFRIVMIKVCRCMLAAYRDKKSGDAFEKLCQAIGEVGKSFPSYTVKVPYEPKPGEPLRFEHLPPDYKQVAVKEICWSRDWDVQLQGAVAAIPSRSRKGVIKIFGRFVKDILAEEKQRNQKSENDLVTADKKARELLKASNTTPGWEPITLATFKPPRR
jgi:hypothetical protein